MASYLLDTNHASQLIDPGHPLRTSRLVPNVAAGQVLEWMQYSLEQRYQGGVHLDIYCWRCLGNFPDGVFLHDSTGTLVVPEIHYVNVHPPHFASGVSTEPEEIPGLMALRIPTNVLRAVRIHEDHVVLQVGRPHDVSMAPEADVAHAARAMALYQKALTLSPDRLAQLEQLSADSANGA